MNTVTGIGTPPKITAAQISQLPKGHFIGNSDADVKQRSEKKNADKAAKGRKSRSIRTLVVRPQKNKVPIRTGRLIRKAVRKQRYR